MRARVLQGWVADHKVGERTTPLNQVKLAYTAIGAPASLSVDDARATKFAVTVTPNPVYGKATVRLSLPSEEKLTVRAFDVLGREVCMVHDGTLTAGQHELALGTPTSRAALNPGVYFLDVSGARMHLRQKFVILGAR